MDPKSQSLLHPHQEALVLPNLFLCGNVRNARVSLMSGLLGAVLYNQNRQQSRVRSNT